MVKARVWLSGSDVLHTIEAFGDSNVRDHPGHGRRYGGLLRLGRDEVWKCDTCICIRSHEALMLFSFS
jgi:hypothetical protein